MWLNILTKVLREFGYENCFNNSVVMIKFRGDKLLLLLIYFDDILAVVDEQENIKLKELLIGKLGSVQYEVNNYLSYLGMQIRVGIESTTIDMIIHVRS
jgi:hypothetical protein